MNRLLPLALLVLGCVTPNPDRALHQRASEHIYRRPLPQLWPEVAAFLVERGYAVPGQRVRTELATEWRDEPSSRAAVRTRYVVVGALADRGVTLHFFLEEEIAPFAPSGVSTELDMNRTPEITVRPLRGSRRVEVAVRRERDLAAEWDFVERVAEQIRAEASYAGR